MNVIWSPEALEDIEEAIDYLVEGYEILLQSEQVATVVRIFEMYRDGYSYLTIATTLNKDGVPLPASSRSTRRSSGRRERSARSSRTGRTRATGPSARSSGARTP